MTQLTAMLCPDCDSDSELVEVAVNVYTLMIQHDDTCPWLAQYQAVKR